MATAEGVGGPFEGEGFAPSVGVGVGDKSREVSMGAMGEGGRIKEEDKGKDRVQARVKEDKNACVHTKT